ncbi:unnamed protein product, partial [Protopolystoma xenopodis]
MGAPAHKVAGRVTPAVSRLHPVGGACSLEVVIPATDCSDDQSQALADSLALPISVRQSPDVSPVLNGLAQSKIASTNNTAPAVISAESADESTIIRRHHQQHLRHQSISAEVDSPLPLPPPPPVIAANPAKRLFCPSLFRAKQHEIRRTTRSSLRLSTLPISS